VIVLDSRNFSEVKVDPKLTRDEVFAEDAKVVLDYLRIKKASVVGANDAGRLALVWANKYPERARSFESCTSNIETTASIK